MDGRRTVHRFNFQLVLGVKLVGNMLSETLVTPGTYDDMLLTVYNNGNVPLSGLDLMAYDVKQGGTPQAFEAIHLDVLNPQNSRITLKKGLEGDTEVKQGVTAVPEKVETTLSQFIEAVAVLIVTSCLIPLLVMAALFWLTKVILGLEINQKGAKWNDKFTNPFSRKKE